MTRTAFFRRRAPLAFRLALLAGMAMVPAVAHAQQKYTKEDIVKVWKERQERVKSASFEWNEEQTDTTGSISETWKIFDKNLQEIIPPKDTTFARQCSASFDDSSLRYEYTTRQWYASENGYGPSSYVSLFDGATCAVLKGPTPERKWHQGQIRKEASHIEYTNSHLQPFLMTFRALTPKMRVYEIANFELTGIKAVIGDTPCLELLQGVRDGLETRLWLDPARAFVLIRCLTITQGKVAHQLDARYKLGPEKEWVPDHWSIVFNKPNGNLRNSYKARLTHYELNVPIPKNQFEMEFPPGTRVIDEKNNREWIVKPSGGKRVLADSEMSAAIARKVHEETMREGGASLSISGSNMWLVLGGVAVALAALTCVLVKYHRIRIQRGKT